MENETTTIKSCEVCDNQNLISVLNLGKHPMCDDLIPIGENRSCREYPIEILFCKICLTAHQRYQVTKRELFPSTYHYRSRFTADVLNGMKNLVESCEDKIGPLKNKKVLDIGANDGSLLDFFKLKGATTLGIEPTDAYRDAALKGHVMYNDFLSESVAHELVSKHGKLDFITFTNVFAHIENLKEVIASLKILSAHHTVIVIENHYLGSVLDGNQFDTFYHEHPRTYSYTSFDYIARSLEMKLQDVEFPARYGGNIRIFFGNTDMLSHYRVDISALKNKESHFQKQFETLSENIEIWQETKKNLIIQHVKKFGKLQAKAFPGRAAILIKLLGLDEEVISAAYEKPGSLKIGHYVPGTRIPIRGDDELFISGNKEKPLLNLAWHIPTEIRNYMKQKGYIGPIFDILSSEDFALSRAAVI